MGALGLLLHWVSQFGLAWGWGRATGPCRDLKDCLGAFHPSLVIFCVATCHWAMFSVHSVFNHHNFGGRISVQLDPFGGKLAHFPASGDPLKGFLGEGFLETCPAQVVDTPPTLKWQGRQHSGSHPCYPMVPPGR